MTRTVGPVSTLLVAATGGHLAELVRLRPRLDLDGPATWITSDSEQSRALLEGERVAHAENVNPRAYSAVARNVPLAWRLAGSGATRVISTGSGIALSFLPLARARGLEVHYIESAARTVGPSLTGRLLGCVPGVRLHAQSPRWAGRRWRYVGSVWDGYQVMPAEPREGPLRVAVALGTMPFPMRRLVERLVEVVPDDAEVLVWQTGATPVDGLPIQGRERVSYGALQDAFRAADVVVSHAGVGSALEAMDASRSPVLVPRLSRFGEHVDDHQQQVADELGSRGLATVRAADAITTDDLLAAARRRVRVRSDPPPITL